MKPQLPQSHVKTVFESVLPLYAARTKEALVLNLLRVIGRLISSDRTSFNEIDLLRGRATMVWNPADRVLLEKLLPAFQTHMASHPLAPYAGRSHAALKITDFTNVGRWRQTPLYNEYYRELGTTYQMAVTLAGHGSVFLPLLVSRAKRDFSERDRAVMNLLSPHLKRAYENATMFERIASRLSLLRKGFELDGQGWIIARPNGTVAEISRHGKEYLQHYFAESGSCASLPATLLHWVRQQRNPDGIVERGVPACPEYRVRGRFGMLTLRLFEHDGYVLLLMQEQSQYEQATSRFHSTLSPREAEVARWVVSGKTNAEVAALLGISARTVHKHLERVFQKVGVEHRTGLAAAWSER